MQYCVRCHPFHTLFQANVDLAFRIRWDGGGGSRELLRNGVSKFVSLLGVLGGAMFLENLRLFDKICLVAKNTRPWSLKKPLERNTLALQPRGKALDGCSCNVFLLRENQSLIRSLPPLSEADPLPLWSVVRGFVFF